MNVFPHLHHSFFYLYADLERGRRLFGAFSGRDCVWLSHSLCHTYSIICGFAPRINAVLLILFLWAFLAFSQLSRIHWAPFH